MDEMVTWPGGEWKTVRMVGKGASGEVYEIQREDFGQYYTSAMKVIRIPKDDHEIQNLLDEGMDEEEVSKYFEDYVISFVRELELLSKLKGYTNIVSYEDHKLVRMEDRFRWMILIRMEMLKPAKTYFRTNPCSEKTVRKLAADICRALEICHEKNIIHRDIKLDNIFLNDRGDFKMGDFGIARFAEKSSVMTVAGTPDYMAPEVAAKAEYGRTADIYSLGIVLYMLANRMRGPFYPTEGRIRPQDREQAMYSRLRGDVVPSPMYGSENLKKVILKAIAYKPEDRYQNAGDLMNALEEKEEDPREGGYRMAYTMYRTARTADELEKAKVAFTILGDYKDSGEWLKKCSQRIRELKEPRFEEKEEAAAVNPNRMTAPAEKVDLRAVRYSSAQNLLQEARTLEDFQKIVQMLRPLNGYRDTRKTIRECMMMIDRLKDAERRKTKIKPGAATEQSQVADTKERDYQQALILFDQAVTIEDYQNTARMMRLLEGYKDSQERIRQCYERISDLKDAERKKRREEAACEKDGAKTEVDLKNVRYQILKGKVQEAVTIEEYQNVAGELLKLGDYKDARELIRKCHERISELKDLERRNKRG